MKIIEAGAIVSTVAGLIIAALGPFAYEKARMADSNQGVDRVITLTGVGKSGVWTTEDVTALNYGTKDFREARIIVRAGERIRLRLKSADVTHALYIPTLGIGPIEVYPSKVAEVILQTDQIGVHTYYCVRDCGKNHFWMKGEIQVVSEISPNASSEPVAGSSNDSQPRLPDRFPNAREVPEWMDIRLKGHALFQLHGCATCHGESGRGGVENPFSAQGEVPALDRLAERMMLFDRESADIVIKALSEEGLDALREDPPIPRLNVVMAQYKAIRSTIQEGRIPGPASPESPPSPLHMPRWEDKLSSEDQDALIAYLISLYPWDDDE